jgi:maleylpyruvate isomerase
MDEELAATIAGGTTAHRRLEATLESIDDEVVHLPSLLPDWNVAHVLTHVAANARSHVRMLDAALAGEAVEQYPGGYEQRKRDIEAGANRAADELRTDVRESNAALEAAWARTTPTAWSGHGLAQGIDWPCRSLPFHRWREVEIHHRDLGLGYSSLEWPEEYVARELPLALATLPDRLSTSAQAAVLAWLVGRAGQPSTIELAPWQANREHYHTAPDGLDTDPRVVTIFRSRLGDQVHLGYEPEARRMEDLAQAMPGFVEIKTFSADDGERVSVVTFASSEEHAAWRQHPEHRVAQRRGRAEFYDEYVIQVCRVLSERRFSRQRDERTSPSAR